MRCLRATDGRYSEFNLSPFDEGEVMWLTKDVMGVRWDLLGEEERKEAFGRELWNEGELEKWDFEQTVKLYGDKKARKLHINAYLLKLTLQV